MSEPGPGRARPDGPASPAAPALAEATAASAAVPVPRVSAEPGAIAGPQPDPAPPAEPAPAPAPSEDQDPVALPSSDSDPDPAPPAEPAPAPAPSEDQDPVALPSSDSDPDPAPPAEPDPDSPAEPDPALVPPADLRSRWVRLVVALVALAGVGCLAVAVLAGRAAVAGQTRPPTPAERAAAAATAVAQRWRSWPAGRIFPAALGYSTTLRGRETARRVGISPDDRCAAALDAALAGPARREGCRAGIRASYVDELDGVVYTTGVLAFPDRARAAAFTRLLAPRRPPAATLRALALPGTASARFSAAARQTATARQDGPYVLLTVAGYADGRPAAATGEYDAAAFSAAGQLAREILVPLNRVAVVNCGRRPWSC